jgi:hypothetical protein
MNSIGYLAQGLFTIGWLAGVASWGYAAYHLARWHFARGTGFHGRKAIQGGAAFLACWLFTFCSGLIGGWFGGWQMAGGF